MNFTPLSWVLMIIQPVLALAAMGWSLMLWRRRTPLVVLTLVWSAVVLVNQLMSLAFMWIDRTGVQQVIRLMPAITLVTQAVLWTTIFWALWTTARAARQ